MQICLVIHGLPAVGKTSVCRQLVHIIGQKLPLGIIQGDFFAHMIYGCTYTEPEIELKYRNMYGIMDSLFSFGRSIIVDDFFRREVDVFNFSRHISVWSGVYQAFVHLKSNPDVILKRNRTRDYWDWITDAKLAGYFVGCDWSFNDEFVLDTSTMNLDDTIESIIAFLIANKIYHPDHPNIIPVAFETIYSSGHNGSLR
jgi:hypothetical protein